MKLGNKGFAISSILYGLLILIVVVMYIFFNTLRSNNNNSKMISNNINDELKVCRDERVNYLYCSTDNCEEAFEKFKNCYCNKIYKDISTCENNIFGSSNE